MCHGCLPRCRWESVLSGKLGASEASNDMISRVAVLLLLLLMTSALMLVQELVCRLILLILVRMYMLIVRSATETAVILVCM